MSARLTAEDRVDRGMTGAVLQSLVVEIAEMYGWSWLHIRPGLRANNRWYVPVEGPLGRGWPDLILFRERDGRRLAVEIKRQTDDPVKPEQAWVLSILAASDVETHVWRPAELRLGIVQDVLR